MLRILIKKQLYESFGMYFVNQKTGKAREKWKTVCMFVFFALLMLLLCGGSFALGMTMIQGLRATPLKLDWLYYALFGGVSILLGVFGSVFNTYAALYLPKDNEVLLSMPIPPRIILLSRLALVYLLAILYSGIVWIPGLVATWVTGFCTPTGVLFESLLILIIPLLVTVITCVLGFLIALLAVKMKGKSFLTVLLTIGFLLTYFYVCFNLSSIFESIMADLSGFGENLRRWGGFLGWLGLAGTGSIPDMALFTGLTIGSAVVCFLIMNRSYMYLLLRKPAENKKTSTVKATKVHDLRTALFLREMRRLFGSATYMMNSLFTAILMPICAVFVILYAEKLQMSVNMITILWAPIGTLLPTAIALGIAMAAGLCFISLPSVSLEGKNLWILQSLPVSGWQILRAKRDLHIIFTAIPAVMLALVIEVCLGISWKICVLTALFQYVFSWITADVGLVLGTKHATFTWTSEIVVIKQNIWGLIIWLGELVYLGIFAACGFFLRKKLGAQWIIAFACLLSIPIIILMEIWLRKRGSVIFDSL